MNLPEAMMAALPLKADGQVIVVGDHRQMPPIVKHDWEQETRRTFQQYEVYTSLFDTLRQHNPPIDPVCGDRSGSMRRWPSSSGRRSTATTGSTTSLEERTSCRSKQSRRSPDRCCSAPRLSPGRDRPRRGRQPGAKPFRAVVDRADPADFWRQPKDMAWTPRKGLGIVVPHRRNGRRCRPLSQNCASSTPMSGLPAKSAIDTVERFQGGERTVIMVSATESDRAYLLAVQRIPPRSSPADGGLEPGETEDDPCRLPQHLLAVQPRRRDVRQLAALEESAAADLLDNVVGRETRWEASGGVGWERRWSCRLT